mmetsp:Transcript_1955/g.3402  ORF Transcript_1955/g.3402 Transcript_1955/m.3402 type:complete len:143 (+) Transcript_1955:306-734(+)
MLHCDEFADIIGCSSGAHVVSVKNKKEFVERILPIVSGPSSSSQNQHSYNSFIRQMKKIGFRQQTNVEDPNQDKFMASRATENPLKAYFKQKQASPPVQRRPTGSKVASPKEKQNHQVRTELKLTAAQTNDRMDRRESWTEK